MVAIHQCRVVRRYPYSSSWAGRCVECDADYKVGDTVWWARGWGSLCDRCHKDSRKQPAPKLHSVPDTKQRKKAVLTPDGLARRTAGQEKARATQKATAAERRRLILLAAARCGHRFTAAQVERELRMMRGFVETTLDTWQWPYASINHYLKEILLDSGLATRPPYVPGARGQRYFTWVDDDDSDNWPPE